jgi:hypothetical protein
MIALTLAALLAPAMAPEVAATVRYDTISCRNVKDAALKDCQIALVPRGDGKISAYVTAPDGRQRIVYFRKGVPTFSNAGSQLRFERNRDTMIISVGTAEVYEVPDRLVAGE